MSAERKCRERVYGRAYGADEGEPPLPAFALLTSALPHVGGRALGKMHHCVGVLQGRPGIALGTEAQQFWLRPAGAYGKLVGGRDSGKDGTKVQRSREGQTAE